MLRAGVLVESNSTESILLTYRKSFFFLNDVLDQNWALIRRVSRYFRPSLLAQKALHGPHMNTNRLERFSKFFPFVFTKVLVKNVCMSE